MKGVEGGRYMKRKNVETMREIRLWIGQIVVPGVTLLTTAMAIPEVRSAVASKANDLKRSIDEKIKKKERA